MIADKKVYAVILAAGSGSRMGSSEKKQFIELGGKPLFYYSFEAFAAHQAVDGVVMVTAESDISYMKDLLFAALDESDRDRAYMMAKLKNIVAGGSERYESVRNALGFLKMGFDDSNAAEKSVILVHDGARPFVDKELIDRVLNKALTGAVIPVVPVKDTIKQLDRRGNVKGTPDRASLCAVQTPQGFPFEMLCSAYEKQRLNEISGKAEAVITDDAMLVEHYLKERVMTVEGDYHNIKLTTEEDLLLAELYLGS